MPVAEASSNTAAPWPAPERQIRPNDGLPPVVLITAFGPFPGVPTNPSGRVAAAVAARPFWRLAGWGLRQATFRTGYALVDAAIALEARREPAPAFVVMLGVAARAKWLRVETRAANRVSVTHRDATAARPARRSLAPGAETFRRGRHPGAPLVRALREAGVPARASRDCGRYVCNAAYWAMLGAMPRDTEVVFVHIPMPARPGMRKRDRRPTSGAMARAVEQLCRLMVRRARLRR